jgi:hypothetical protein
MAAVVPGWLAGWDAKDERGEKQILYTCSLHGLDHVVRVCVCVGVMTWGGVCLHVFGMDGGKIELLAIDTGCLCVKALHGSPQSIDRQTDRHDSTFTHPPPSTSTNNPHLFLQPAEDCDDQLAQPKSPSNASMIRLLSRAVPCHRSGPSKLRELDRAPAVRSNQTTTTSLQGRAIRVQGRRAGSSGLHILAYAMIAWAELTPDSPAASPTIFWAARTARKGGE